MLADFTGVSLVVGLAALAIVILLVGARALGPQRRFAEKLEPFDGGTPVRGTPQRRTAVKFHRVAPYAVLALVGWLFVGVGTVVLRELGWAGYGALLCFVAPLAVGFLHQRAKGGLDG